MLHLQVRSILTNLAQLVKYGKYYQGNKLYTDGFEVIV